MVRRDNIPQELYEDVKAYCQIYWDDEATERKIRGLIATGMIYINGKLGGEMDYNKDGMHRQLLMDFVRYGRDDALDVFENNYLSMIIGTQLGGVDSGNMEDAEQNEE